MNRVVFRGPRWIVAASLLGAAVAVPLATPRPAWAQTFRLGPDDVIAVQVANHPEMSAPEIPVGSSGKVALPLVGSLTVGGLSLAQTQTAIAQALRGQLRSPQVTVSLVRSRPRQVIALGAVTKPGAVDVQPGWRVSEVLAAVGGLSMPVENVTATLTRAKMAPMPLLLAQIADSPQNSANVRLLAGDVINIVPIAVNRVTVSGDVMTPSQITLRRAPKVMDAIVAAGGLKAKPEETRGTILRGQSTKITLDLPAVYRDRASAANVALKDGDLLSFETVHTNVTVFSVDNLVKSPGSYQMGSDATAVSALVKAGGLTVPPNGVVASIRRGAQIMPVNLESAVYDPSKDLPLMEGDVLLLAYPEGPQITMTGAVAIPGTMRVKQGTSLLEAVVKAGGLTFKPDQVRVSILRTMPDGKQVTLAIDPVALWDLRDLGQNVQMQQGDMVIVNQGIASQTVFVSGEVLTPGAMEINPKDSLPEVILRAGGPTKLASLTRVTVTRRDGTTQMIDVSSSLQANAPKLNFPMQTGDIVVVPANENRVLVMNDVVNPGYIPIPEKGTLSIGDAIMAAGGARAGAKLQEVAILRRTPTGVDKQIVSLADVTNGFMSLDKPLQNGDVVYVPAGRVGPKSLTSVAQTLGSLGAFIRFGTLF